MLENKLTKLNEKPFTLLEFVWFHKVLNILLYFYPFYVPLLAKG